MTMYAIVGSDGTESAVGGDRTNNRFATREEAEQALVDLAQEMECSTDDLSVVELDDDYDA